MTHFGLCYPYIAVKSGNAYTKAYTLGKVIEVEIEPTYEDAGVYGSINSLAPRKEFTKADITLNVTDELLSYINRDNGLALENPDGYGLGLITKRTDKRYETLWFPQVYLWPAGKTYSTLGDSINFATDKIKGIILPYSDDGKWKKTIICESKAKARTALFNETGLPLAL